MQGSFKTVKKGYDPKEVNRFLAEYKLELDKEMDRQKDLFSSLKENNASLKREIEELKSREKLISEAIISAQEKAREIVLAAQAAADIETERIKDFSVKINEYFLILKKKYPVPEMEKEEEKFNDLLNELISGISRGQNGRSPEKDYAAETARISSGKRITAVQKDAVKAPAEAVEDTLAGEYRPFDMEKALNPDMELGELCRQLGLME